MGTGSFTGVKRPGGDVDHPPPSKRRGHERVELYLYSPSGPSWPVIGSTFTFTLYIKLHYPLSKKKVTSFKLGNHFLFSVFTVKYFLFDRSKYFCLETGIIPYLAPLPSQLFATYVLVSGPSSLLISMKWRVP
jgi:hypothetical protein